jgi:hypothetical protein
VTADPAGQELNIGERVNYTRSHLAAEQRERAARLDDHGGPSWQQQKRLVEEGRWDELFPGPGRDVDEVVGELLPEQAPLPDPTEPRIR